MDTNVAPTTSAPVIAYMAMEKAVAAAINPSSTSKTTDMRSSTSQPKNERVTDSAMLKAHTSLKARSQFGQCETFDRKPDLVRKAISDFFSKKEQEKMQATSNSKAAQGEWSHPTVTKAEMTTNIQMKGGLYTPVKNDITQIANRKTKSVVFLHDVVTGQ